MTPDGLRSLADEATATPSVDETPDEYRARWEQIDKIHALAPDLARLCAEYAGAFAQIEKLHHKDFDLAPQIAYRALAKMEALKS